MRAALTRAERENVGGARNGDSDGVNVYAFDAGENFVKTGSIAACFVVFEEMGDGGAEETA